MIELDSTEKEEPTEEERIPVFSIKGISYDMPAIIKPHVALKYLWLIKEQGSDYATAWLMEAVLGKAGFQALADYEPLTVAQLDHIKNIVQDAAMGAVEGQGKDRYSGNAHKKSSGSRNTKKTLKQTSDASTG
jgi:hypothetical protein